MIVYPYKERNMSGWYYFDDALHPKDIDLLEKSAKPNLITATTEAGNKKEIRNLSDPFTICKKIIKILKHKYVFFIYETFSLYKKYNKADPISS